MSCLYISSEFAYRHTKRLMPNSYGVYINTIYSESGRGVVLHIAHFFFEKLCEICVLLLTNVL